VLSTSLTVVAPLLRTLIWSTRKKKTIEDKKSNGLSAKLEKIDRRRNTMADKLAFKEAKKI
jgi:hypothetical protein